MQNNGSKVIHVDIEKEMKNSFLDYSMSVIVSRALPDVRDGLKPVHRRILYTMYEKGLTPEKAYRKCADTVGAVLGSYHPHGDSSVYDAMVRLAQDFSMRYPFVDGQGNFGSVDGDPPAAYRYTEAKMSKISTHMLTDIDKNTVDFVPNYDDRLKEPEVLPSRLPNLLINGSTGIAVGMATNIPPHNLREVIDAVCLLIENPEATLDELMEKVKGPDFPTGGIIMGRSGIRSAYATGRGKVILRGRVEVEEHGKDREKIIITEIPYMVNKSRLVEQIAENVKEKRIDQISDLRDESDRDGMRIVVELKRDANTQLVINQLYRYTQLQETVGVIMLALSDKQPKIMTLAEILNHYINFQEEIITRRTQFELEKAKDREHILEGLKIVIDNTDEVISIIRHSKDIPESRLNLIERFAMSDKQAAAIVAMRIGQLSGMERIKIEEELLEILKKVAELQKILGDITLVRDIVKTELLELREKYGDDRRTEIMAVSGEVDIEDLIPVQESVITLTHFGYIKRQPMDAYKTQRRGGRGVSSMAQKDEDFVEELFVCSSHDYVLFFTNYGRVYRLKAYEIAESSRVARGTNIVNLLELSEGEKITSMIKVDEYDDDSYLCMVTNKGVIKRTALSLYQNVRKSGLIAINLDPDDKLSWVRRTTGSNQLLVATKKGMAIRFEESDARTLGRTARGVRAIRLSKDDEVVGMVVVTEGAKLLTVSENGKGRRTDFENYRLQSRGGKGIRNYHTLKNGLVAGVIMVEENDDVIIISDDGILIRTIVGEITEQSRYGSGVRVMRMAEDSRVVTLARTPHEDDEELEEADGENTQGGEETTAPAPSAPLEDEAEETFDDYEEEYDDEDEEELEAQEAEAEE